ncbi:MAG: sigma-54 dependent transcriptional regulator [bacterium]|nr:sigma-54-dependent Fis family transcriptional regulator [Gammaproteobacteria bacterium]HIL94883.1 sigma-54-dependent Fis family transcriptional regulator [Pseudomonadales bacterium]
MSRRKKLLIVDDDEKIVQSLRRLLNFEPYDVVGLNDPFEAIELAKTSKFDVILSDNRMPGMSGVELMSIFLKMQPDCRRISMSAYQDFDSLVDAFNQSHIELFIQKPWENDALKQRLARFLSPVHPTEPGSIFDQVVTQSDSMYRIFDRIKALRGRTFPVFIQGETGTGKELIARAIHDQSARRSGNFVAVNCSNINAEIMESQLFGHRKGAFTGAINDQKGLLAAADGGALFLDEVTELPGVVQSKLLRALQEMEFTPVGDTKTVSFDAQIISAAATSLQIAIEEKTFRADLMYRLQVITIDLPPLRERPGDILMLFKHFAESEHVSPKAIDALEAYDWPGNVRELQNASSYALVFADGGPIHSNHLPVHITNGGRGDTQKSGSTQPMQKTVARNCLIGTTDINEALRKHNHNKTAAAKSLGISRMSLWRYMTRLKIN